MSSELLVVQNARVPRRILSILIFLLILGLAGTSGYFYYQYTRLSKSPIIDQVQAEEESAKLIREVGKLMLLPKDETPTVATVTDLDKLKDQPFFKDAKNGNKVLIYPNIKQVIIYDPEAKLIINVGSINFSGDQAQESPAPSEQPKKTLPESPKPESEQPISN